MAKISLSARQLPGLSLTQLLKATPPFIKNNAEDVIVRSLAEKRTRGGLPGVKAKALSVTNKHKTEYLITVVGKDVDKKLSERGQKLVCHCSCDFFWSHCEYALTHWAASTIKYSNGEPAHVTNPSNVPLVCKHLVRVLRYIKDHNI